MSIATALSKGLARVSREHYKEKKRQERGRRGSYRAWKAPEPILKDAVFEAMPEAIAQASGDGALPFGVRTLFYKIRPLIAGEVNKELQYSYFTPPLVTEYEEENGPIPGLYYDPRGNMMEPHTGTSVPLGTTAVSGYTIPEWLFNKVLYVEKEGFGPVFEATKLAERYDMAIMGGKGYATRAAKDLLAAAERENITVLVLHDCDVEGYEISRTLTEATRTSWHTIDVIDIGLSVADVTAMSLATEGVSMRKRPPWEFQLRLTAEEKEFFLTNRLRTEINAMASDQLINFVETKLEEHGLTEKVVPPADVARDKFLEVSKERLTDAAGKLAARALKETLGVTLDDLNRLALQMLMKDYSMPKGFYTRMGHDLNNGQREQSWRAYAEGKAEGHSQKAVRAKKGAALEALAKELLARLTSRAE